MVERYWVVYYLVYAACAAFFLSRRWAILFQDGTDYIHILAAIFGASAGIALLFAIAAEVTGRMVLLIPQAVKKIMEKGRAEGRIEGRAEGRTEGRIEGRAEGRIEGRAEQRNRREEAYRRFGVEVDGVKMLPMTPEVEEFLNNGDGSSG